MPEQEVSSELHAEFQSIKALILCSSDISCEYVSGDEDYEESLVTKRHYLKPTVVEVDAHA